jgi:hypothetical protein
MVDKRRVRRAISLSSYPLIREFLGELAGTFVLVVYIQKTWNIIFELPAVIR